MNIGFKIRKYRLNQKRTLQEIADQCGCTKSLMSKIENGKTIPPISTLMKIAEALGIKTSALLDDDDGVRTVHNPAAGISKENFVATDKGYSFFPIASERPDKRMQPFLFCARKGEVKALELSHKGEEYIYMLEGCMKYKVGDTEYFMNPGDSLYFDSVLKHELCPVSSEVKYLAVFFEE